MKYFTISANLQKKAQKKGIYINTWVNIHNLSAIFKWPSKNIFRWDNNDAISATKRSAWKCDFTFYNMSVLTAKSFYVNNKCVQNFKDNSLWKKCNVSLLMTILVRHCHNEINNIFRNHSLFFILRAYIYFYIKIYFILYVE